MSGRYDGLQMLELERCSSSEARTRDQIAGKLTPAQRRALIRLGGAGCEAHISRRTADVLSQFGLITSVDWTWCGYAVTPRGRWVTERIL